MITEEAFEKFEGLVNQYDSTKEGLKEDIKERIKELANDINRVAEIVCENETLLAQYDIWSSLLERGANPELIFNTLEYELSHYSPDKAIEILRVFLRYNTDKEALKNWIDRYLCSDDIIKYHEELKIFEIDIKKYTNEFLDSYGEHYLSSDAIVSLPNIIPPDNILNHFTAREILNKNKALGFERFIEQFDAKGGDINKLAQKIANEASYPYEYDEACALGELIEYGSKAIDIDDFAECLDYEEIAGFGDDAWFYNILYAAGAKEEYLDKLAG